MDSKTALVFKFAELAQLYASKMEQMLGVKCDHRVHLTRLKQRLLAYFSNMQGQHQGHESLFAFDDDLDNVL